MKKTFRLFLAALVALSFAGCIYVVDPNEGNNNASNSSNNGNSSEEGESSSTDPFISFVFDPQPVDVEGYVQVNILPSNKSAYYGWGMVKASETTAFSTVEEYVKTYVAEAVENGATYAGWKHDGKITCSDVAWTLAVEPSTDYYIYAFQVSGSKLAVYGHVASHKYSSPAVKDNPEIKAPDGYLDMGLPSGTHWYYNATGWLDYYTYSELNAMIPGKDKGAAIPTEEQWNELRQYCKWESDGAGFNVDSKNGNKLGFYLPFIGAYNGEEKLNDGTHGYYWTSSESGGQVNMAIINEYGDIEFKTVSKTGQWKTSGIFVWKP